ncbi:MAG: asparagine synthase (glutamine-hydrolyzing) [Desulfovibrio sp.]|uniref:asparagine synthase (glutamine-hydrolyzing) n=1 Tax=Desulfovibrio sp. TaxID=885 RepID=UPI00135DBA57|nr:asparagine synthase (glutamine-hydrolyzing) [Desulfovibrio sp.]MTJ93804.1 asparagine synthase (glutamine-hydrolyzing) [Desulfovibrio sp.]
MCGIAGLFSPSANINAERLQVSLEGMTKTLAHRGPDAEGLWADPVHGIGLGHKRLSIRDLSPTGAQPMQTGHGRHVIAYNGEIYNAEELRSELHQQGVSFDGTSDTEVVLKGCALHGVEAFVPRMIGMFAFAFWDAEKRQLSLVRDRLGVKPLYYACFQGVWGFASELKALYKHPHWKADINRQAVTQFLRYGYIHGPISIFSQVYKLLPGSLLQIDASGTTQEHVYWDAREKMREGQRTLYRASHNELVESTHRMLRDAVKRRMVADVSLGAFLSGGIDSSLVVALMQAQTSQRVRTFSIGFSESEYDEAPYAKAIATHLGADHTELYMEPKDAWDVIPQLASMYDEPFGDSSQLPTYLLSAMTRKHVTVALSGDGGDEVFAGYARYFLFEDTSSIEKKFWKLASDILQRTPASLLQLIARCAPARYKQDFVGRLTRMVERHYVDYLSRYRQVCLTHWPAPGDLVVGGSEPHDVLDDRGFLDALAGKVSQMQAADTLCYLPDDILVKVDRASMAVSLEVRVPLLDHRLFEHAWRLPADMKVRNGLGKIVLREVLSQYVPRQLFERPKMGFGVPIDHWLRGPLKDWAQSLLDPHTMKGQGLLRPEAILPSWQRHLAGENFAYPIWNVLMLEGFLQSSAHAVCAD